MAALQSWLKAPFESFCRAFTEGRLPGAVIICGSEKSGVNELALQCAKTYLCHEPSETGACGHCPSCGQFENGGHVDFLGVHSTSSADVKDGALLTHNPLELLEAYPQDAGHTVRVDSLREMSRALLQSAAAGDRKAAVVTSAHLMNPSAANSILKTFEEPLPDTLIILVCDRLENLLPTIVSRAFKITVPPVSATQALEFLNIVAGSPREALARCALAVCHNAPYGARDCLENGQAEAALNCVKLIADDLLSGTFKASPGALLKLEEGFREAFLHELLLESLKYKARVPLSDLPLLNEDTAPAFAKLKANALFKADSALANIAVKPPQLPPRAPL